MIMMDLFADIVEPILPFSFPNDSSCYAKWDQKLNGFAISVPNGELFYSQNFFGQTKSDIYLKSFLENNSNIDLLKQWDKKANSDLNEINFKNIKWKQDFINFYGKKIPLPRLTSWYGDPGKSYSYSGINSNPNPWNTELMKIKETIDVIAQTQFNSVLLNCYRDGEDYLSWHADDEKELGRNPIIGSVNFGAERDFCLKQNDGPIKLTLPLCHGTLLIMKGELQHFWQHSVPKRKKVKDVRINLTYRVIN